MRIKTAVTADPFIGTLLFDGVAKTSVDAFAGHTLEMDVDLSAGPFPTGSLLWATVDQNPADYTFTSDGSARYKLPVLTALQGLPLPGLTGGMSDIGDKLLSDYSVAIIDDLSNVVIPYSATAVDPTLPSVAVSWGGKVFRAPRDFHVETTSTSCWVVLGDAAVPPIGTKLTIKTSLAPWVTGNGTALGALSASPNPGERFKTVWLAVDGSSAPPVPVRARSEPKNQTAPLVSRRLPRSITEGTGGNTGSDGLNQFISALTDYVSQKQGSVDLMTRIDQIVDPDLTYDSVIPRLLSQYASFLPADAVADPRLILKHAVRFYENRGNPQSFAFLIRAIFNAKASVSAPGDRALRGSYASWRRPQFVRVISVQQALNTRPDLVNSIRRSLGMLDQPVTAFGDQTLLPSLQGCRVVGVTSGATGAVEAVNQYVIGGVTVTELEFLTLVGQFQADELVDVTAGLDLTQAPVGFRTNSSFVCVVGKQVTALASGSAPAGFSVTPGARVAFSSGNASAFVSAVSNGIPTAFELSDAGWVLSPVTASVTDAFGNILPVTVTVGTMNVARGSWIGGPGFASDAWIVPRDSFYIQPFSYEIGSEIQQTQYSRAISKSLHPAGFRMFSGILDEPIVTPSGGLLEFSVDQVAANSTDAPSNFSGDPLKISVTVDDQLVSPDTYVVSSSKFGLFVTLDTAVVNDSTVVVEGRGDQDMRVVPDASDYEAISDQPLTISSPLQDFSTADTFFGTALGEIIQGQGTLSPYTWHVFVTFAPTPNARRFCSLGVRAVSLYNTVGHVEAFYRTPTQTGCSIGFQSLAEAQAFSFARGVLFNITDETESTLGETDVLRETMTEVVRVTMDGTPRGLSAGLPVGNISVRISMDGATRLAMDGDFRRVT